jgi:hypothetical protein
MDRILSGLYGASENDDDQSRVSKANDFVSRVETGDKTQGYSTEEAVQNYRNVTQGLSDDEFEHVAEDALRQLTPEQRREFTRVIKQQGGVDLDDNVDDAHELASLTKQFRSSSTGDFGGLLGGLLGGGSGGSNDIMNALVGLLGGGGMPGTTSGTTGARGGSTEAGLSGLLGNPIVKTVLGLIAANAMKRMMGGGQQETVARARPSTPSGPAGNDSGGGILDSLFGGGDDANRSRQERGQQESGGGLLDSLFGGGDDDRDDRARDSDKTVDVSRIERDRKSKGI